MQNIGIQSFLAQEVLRKFHSFTFGTGIVKKLVSVQGQENLIRSVYVEYKRATSLV